MLPLTTLLIAVFAIVVAVLLALSSGRLFRKRTLLSTTTCIVALLAASVLLLLAIPVIVLQMDLSLSRQTPVVVGNAYSGVFSRYMHDSSPVFTQGLNRITVSDRNIYFALTYLFGNGGATAMYIDATREMYFHSDGVTWEVWQHELAHHVWYESLTPDERAAWTTMHDTTEFFPTEYATKNAAEDYADSFMLYFTNRAYRLDLNRTLLLHSEFRRIIPAEESLRENEELAREIDALIKYIGE